MNAWYREFMRRSEQRIRRARRDPPSLQYEEAATPLVYDRADDVRRFLAFSSPLVSVPFVRGDSYFAETKQTLFRSPSGRALKKPRHVLVPGAAPGTLAWVDWHPYGKDGVYIDFMKVRSDFRGQGHARALIEAFYRDVVLPRRATLVHWGRVMHPNAWKLMMRMKAAYPSIQHIARHDF